MQRKTLKILSLAVAAAFVLMVAGCGGDDDAASDGGGDAGDVAGDLGDARMFPLVEQNDSGLSGEFTISPVSDSSVRVGLEVEGSDGGPHPAHIHTGSCEDLGAIAYPLENVEDGSSDTTVDGISLEELEDGDYAVNVHESEEEIQTYVACGEL